jgi:hypothetical protein
VEFEFAKKPELVGLPTYLSLTGQQCNDE